MKADRRHELRENDLAHTIEVLRARIADNARPISIAVMVAAGVFVAASLMIRKRMVATEEKWHRLSQLQFDKPETARESLETITGLTKDAKDDRFSLAALIEQGKQGLLFAQRADAAPDPTFNAKARQAFEELLRRFPENPMAFGVARCGLATVEENDYVLTRDSACKERARKHLNAVIENPIVSGMPFQTIAVNRRNSLDHTFSGLVFGTTPTISQPAAQPTVGSNIKLPFEAKLLTAGEAEALTQQAQAEAAKPQPALVNRADDVDDESEEVDEADADTEQADPADPKPTPNP